MLARCLYMSSDDQSSDGTGEAIILFRETCYDEDMKKFRLICLDNYLENTNISGSMSQQNIELSDDDAKLAKSSEFDNRDSNSPRLSSVRGCMDFISNDIGGQNLLRRIEQLAHDFDQWQTLAKMSTKVARYVHFHRRTRLTLSIYILLQD